MNEHITLNEVKGPNRTFKLNQPIVLEVVHDEYGLIVEHTLSGISGASGTENSVKEAVAHFCEMFELQYESLVECDISELHWSALNLRASLIALVKVC